MTWDEVRLEIQSTQPAENQGSHDIVRRAKIADVERISGIPLIVYAVDFTDEGRAGQYGPGLQIDLDDKTGFSQAFSDLPANGPLDVLVHSPGGSPTATESIVKLLRARFGPIRFIVPHTAKSAATMLALSGDEILLGEAAELGPIDPQLRFSTGQRLVNVPAQAAIDQFNRAHQEIAADPNRMRVWLPILQQYGPSFIQECQNAITLSKALATEWLRDYMFAEEEDAQARAENIANWLAEHNNFNTHSRPVWMQQLLQEEPTMKIGRLADIGQEFESAVMAVYWAIDVTFAGTPAFKIIEHRAGSAYVRLMHTAITGPIPVQEQPAKSTQKPTRGPQGRAALRRQQQGRR